MELNKNAFLEKESVGKLMLKYSVPCIISLLVAALYNIVDQIFIANADYLGSYGNAANTAVYPLPVIPPPIGDGCCAYVSIKQGSGEHDKVSRSIGSAVVVSVVAGIVITAVYALFADQLIIMFGGGVNDETFRLSKEYFIYITAGIPFYVFGQAMNPVIRSDGSPRFAMISTLAGAVVNIILDPVFIFTFRLGMMGAAVATVLGQVLLGQVLTAVLAIIYLTRMKTVKLSRSSLRFHSSVAREYIPLGICSFLSQISLVAAMAAINNMLKKYGALDPIFGQDMYSQIPMAVIGIVMKFFQIVISVVIGMAAGCIPVVGYNVGAGRNDRVKKLLTRLLIAEAAGGGIWDLGAIGLIAVELFPRQLIGIFGAANESVYYTDFAVRSFRVYLCLLIPACINKAAFIFLQSLGKPVTSTMLSMVREVIFGVGFALLLPIWFGLDGVLYSMPLSDALAFIVSLIVIAATYRELSVPRKSAVLQAQ